MSDAVEELRQERLLAVQRVREIERAIAELEPDTGPKAVTLAEFEAEQAGFEWLIGGMIAEGTMNMIVADPGLGKSTLMAQMSLSLAAGKNFLGARIPAPTRTLMIQAEGSRAAFRHRVRTARLALGTHATNFWYIQAENFTDYRIGSAGLLAIVKESKAKLVILDTIGYFATFKENDAVDWKEKVAIPLRLLIAETGASVILVHHQPKPNESNKEQRDGRGTSAMLADCDHFWKLESVKDQPTQLDFIVRKNKYGVAGTQRLAFDAGSAIFRIVD